jgi:hypothetical protein
MSLHPIKHLMLVGSVVLLSIGVAQAQTPPPEAMAAARSLVTTLKLSDQYKALLPVILLGLKPSLVQDRPEIERDFDTMIAAVADAYTPYYNAMVDSIATVYANTFSVDELHQIETFYRQPVGQKLLEKSLALRQQSVQIGEEASRRATEDLRTSLTQLLREKGHKL